MEGYQARLWSDIISVNFLPRTSCIAPPPTWLSSGGTRAHVAGGRAVWVRDDFKIATYGII